MAQILKKMNKLVSCQLSVVSCQLLLELFPFFLLLSSSFFFLLIAKRGVSHTPSSWYFKF
ncbi:MAG: hypothetical protein ACLBM3_22785 [Dolichospermum sp.]